MNCIVNPKNFDKNYLENLNLCFPNWGNEATFRWVFERKFEEHKPDYFILNSTENQLLAGSALSYRKLKYKNQNYTMGIMTGSWTLPISRGMGCFSQAIKQSVALVFQKKMDFLTAFVTQSNGSFRRLKDAGSFLIASNYIVSQKLENKSVSISEIEILEKNDQNLRFIFDLRTHLQANKIHFEYNFDNFKGQFFERLHPTFLLKIQNEYAIVEENNTMFQLHYSTNNSKEVITKIVDWANQKNKEIIFFSTIIEHSFANNEDFKVIPGFFTILKSALSQSMDLEAFFNPNIDFEIQYGDKM